MLLTALVVVVVALTVFDDPGPVVLIVPELVSAATTPVVRLKPNTVAAAARYTIFFMLYPPLLIAIVSGLITRLKETAFPKVERPRLQPHPSWFLWYLQTLRLN